MSVAVSPRLTVGAKALASALQAAIRVTPRRTPMEVLNYLLIEATDRTLTISATDLGKGIVYRLPLTLPVEQPWKMAVPAKLITDFVASIGDGDVDLVPSDNRRVITVRGGSYTANLNCFDADEYPPITTDDCETLLTMDADPFRVALSQVIVAVATDDTRPTLTGVLFHRAQTRLTLTGADGFRLASRDLPDVFQGEGAWKYIVPLDSLKELLTYLRGAETFEFMASSERNQVVFRVGQIDFISRVIDGTYPNYRQIIPTGSRARLTFATKDGFHATRIAGLFANPNGQITQLKWGDGMLRMVGKGDSGDAESDVAIDITYREGEKPEKDLDTIALNNAYMLDVFNTFSSERIRMDVRKPTDPVLFTPDDDTLLYHVVMPMYLSK